MEVEGMRKISDEVLNKAYYIQFEEEDAMDGFHVLLHNSSCLIGVYPNDRYVVGKEHLKFLKRAGIPYKILTE